MPRFKKQGTWKLLYEVPPNLFPLTREALSLRQTVVATRQTLIFLQRCKMTGVIPAFISNKKIGATCGLPETHPKILNVYRSILSVVIKEKQHMLYSSLLKCRAKEQACQRHLPERIWRRIESGSRSICDSLRSNVKSTLCAKYNRLLDKLHGDRPNSRDRPTVSHQTDQLTAPNESTIKRERVTVIGNVHISANALNLLELGPSFSPARNINAVTFRKVVGGLHRLRDQLRDKLRRDSQPQNSAYLSRRALPVVPFPRLFYKEPTPMHEADIKFRILASGVLETLNKYKRRRHSNMTREQWEGFRQLREMTNNGSIRVSVSDKGGEFVIIPQALDREITDLHLRDASVYRQTDEKEFMAQCRRLNDIWVQVAKLAGIDERFVSRLKIDHPKCPVFYSLVKTHKLSSDDMGSMSPDTYKIRPIVSCVGGPTDRISWFLTKIVGQLLPKIPAHLTNTNQFLERLRASNLDCNSVIESFDVTSLYTNVENNNALQAVLEMLEIHAAGIEMYGLSIRRTITLIKECLSCNIFKWSGRYFSQIRGLAMGQRLAPVLAICFMSRIEQPVLARLPLLYCRYIDDCFIATSTQSEMDECFTILNEQSENIRFTREAPKDGWLAYLNTHISLSSGTIRVKWYRKATSKNIILHAMSAHPAPVKRAVVRNMFKTAYYISTGEAERQESLLMASNIASSNGYMASSRFRTRHSGTPQRTHEDKLTLCLPFVSDEMSADIRRCLKRAQLQNDVTLVNIPNDNIKKQLVRNRLYDKECISKDCIVCPHGKNGDCSKAGVVYQITCLNCGALYIGETGRVLSIRIKEHLASKRRGSLVSALGKHRHEGHNGNDFDVMCTILIHETDITARKALEGFWISARNPSMNNRNECVSITNDFLPFVSLCEL